MSTNLKKIYGEGYEDPMGNRLSQAEEAIRADQVRQQQDRCTCILTPSPDLPDEVWQALAKAAVVL